MTRYKVQFEIAVQDTSVNGLRTFEETLAGMLGENVPASSGWATTIWPKFGEFEKVETTLLGSTPVDPRWKAILEKVDEIGSNDYASSSRGTSLEGHRGELSCVAKYYRRTTENGRPSLSDEKYVFVITCEKDLKVKVEGPYVDSGDRYWEEMSLRDEREGDALITDKWDHYTVHKDSKNPGSCDGFGGAEFRFVLFSRAKAEVLEERGFKIVVCDDGTRILVTRNLWSQSRIPTAHRHLFVRNCKDLGSVKAIEPLDLESSLHPFQGHTEA